MRNLVCKVCGMIINDKNYGLNSESIPQCNKEEEVLYCPFCGASYEYICEDEKEIYAVNPEELDEETLTILDKAVKLEIFNGDYYKVASKMAKAEEVRKLFEGLSRIEYVHARIHRKLGGFKEVPVLNQLNYEKYDTDDALLELAEKREEHAVNYYNKYSKEVCSPIIAKVFKALSEVETDHIRLAEEAK